MTELKVQHRCHQNTLMDRILRQFHPVLTITIHLPNNLVILSSHVLLCLPSDHFLQVPKENSICIFCIFHPRKIQHPKDYCILETVRYRAMGVEAGIAISKQNKLLKICFCKLYIK
jgi:hypothetical protein